MRLSAGMPMIGRCRDMFIILSEWRGKRQPRGVRAGAARPSKRNSFESILGILLKQNRPNAATELR